MTGRGKSKWKSIRDADIQRGHIRIPRAQKESKRAVGTLDYRVHVYDGTNELLLNIIIYYAV